jgi:putative FmdB family regulatory protein
VFASNRGDWVPVYEYRCEEGHEFEVIQRMSDEALTVCEVCGSPAQRVLYAPAIHFKGTGFHNTDYGTKNRPRDTSGGDGAAKTDSASTTASDGAAKTVKEATPADRAKRGVGP